MKATILAPGSRGDVQPYIALGQALSAQGHRCTIVTTMDHGELVRGYGLDVAEIPIHVAAELQQINTRRAVEGGGIIASFRQFAAIAGRAAQATVQVSLDASRDADVVVANFSTALLAHGIGQKLGVPIRQAFNVPLTPTAELPGALLPWLDFGPISRRCGGHLSRLALWLTARTSANQACIDILGVPPAPRLPRGHGGLVPGPVLYGFSEALLPRPADWPADVQVTGFWFVEERSGYSAPPDLVDFLSQGPPPVCVGFGSMGTESPETISALVVGAARIAGVRLVLLAGWAGLKPGMLSSEVFALPSVPHSWLYPRCRAVVHHGGAGTTAAALWAGVPAVVVPFHGDQPFWASRVERAGLGPAPIPRRSLTAGRLAAAMGAAVNHHGLQERAAAFGRRVRGERGAQQAATLISSAGTS